MDREIKFRGKRVDNGEWVYGSLICYRDECYIAEFQSICFDASNNDIWVSIPSSKSLVDPSTVGQYTGLHDKDGKEIYEGDIGWDGQNECYGVVEFSDGNFSYVWENICTDLFEVAKDIDFIGNIHDNPELISQKQKVEEL